MKHEELIYSRWLWILSLLYYFGVNPYSPLLPMIFAIVFCITYLSHFYNKFHWSKKICVISFELFFGYLAYIKNPSRDLFNTDDFRFTLLIMLIYSIAIKVKGTSVNEIYFKTIPEYHKDKDENLIEHVKRILSDK